MYSIREWNKHYGHKSPYDFIEQDKKLEEQVYKLNGKIRELNKKNGTQSPIFSTDLIRTSKTTKNKKKTYIHKKENIHFHVI